MSVYNNLNSVKKLSNSSVTSIVDVTNLNFKKLSDANLEFLSNIKYDESANTISLNKGTFTYVDITDTLSLKVNGIPTFTIDSLGRAEGKEILVSVAETKRQRLTDFPDWPDEGVPGEIIYTGIQNQRPEFGEDFIGYLDGRGWVSLTTLNSAVSGIQIIPEAGSPLTLPTVNPGTGLLWVGPPGYENSYDPQDVTVYFSDDNGNVFDIITDPVWELIEGSPDDAKFKPLGTAIIGDITNNGSLRYVDGNQQSGYVLTSDALGNASWQPSTGGGGTGALNAAYVQIVDLYANTAKTVTHNLGSSSVHVQLIDLDTGALIESHVDNYTTNSVDITSSQDNNNVKVVIIAAGGASPTSLFGLTDVDLVSPLADGDILVYNATSNTWVNSVNTGGSGDTVIAGDGIDVNTVGSDEEVSINLDTTQTNLVINGSGELTFDGVHVKDEGVDVGTYRTINFIGDDVLAQDSGTPGQVNVYIPTPTFASHFNTTDGTTTGTVSENIINPGGGYWSREIVRISTPTSEASPYFKTNGWAGTNQDAYPVQGSSVGAINFTTAQAVTGFSADGTGDATITVNVYDADGTTVLHTYTTPTLYANGTYNNLGDTRVVVTISGYAVDTSKYKASVNVQTQAETIFNDHSLDGGRYHVEIIMNTDTATDGGNTYTYTQDDIFLDTNSSPTPTVDAMVLQESSDSTKIQTKHLSGVEYYILNSWFEVDGLDFDDLNRNTQGRYNISNRYTSNFTMAAADYGLPGYTLAAWSPSVGTFSGSWTNQWDLVDANYAYDSWAINNTNYRFRNTDAVGTMAVYDPWTGPADTAVSVPAKILVDTWGLTSTNLGEDFDDESERLTRGSSSYSTFDSTATLGTSISNQTGSSGPFDDACVVGSRLVRADKFFADNGDSPSLSTLIPDLTLYKANKGGTNPDYSGYSDVPTYHRKFYTSSGNNISNLKIYFGGSFGTSGNAATALANSQLKFYIRRVATNSSGSFGHGANPLALHGGLYNSGLPTQGWDDGASGVDTPGSLIRTAVLSGTSNNGVEATFGSATQAAVGGFWAEIQIIDPDIKLDYVNVTLVFSNGTEESNPV